MAAALISCGAFVLLAVKCPLDTRRVSRIAVTALVTANVIQCALWARGGWRNGADWNRELIFVFSFKKSTKTSAD